jgi:hypothetical protein
MFRRVGIAFPLLPKAGDVDVHGVGSDEGLLFPDLLQDLFARQDLPMMIDEEAEQLDLLGRESDNVGTAKKFVTHKVRCNAAEFHANDWRELFFVVATQERVAAGKEFIGIEGFYRIRPGNDVCRGDRNAVNCRDVSNCERLSKRCE